MINIQAAAKSLLGVLLVIILPAAAAVAQQKSEACVACHREITPFIIITSLELPLIIMTILMIMIIIFKIYLHLIRITLIFPLLATPKVMLTQIIAIKAQTPTEMDMLMFLLQVR